MGFRPPLDLSEILPDYPALHDPNAPMRLRPKTPTLGEELDLLRQRDTEAIRDTPVLIDDGPAVCSSCTDLALDPEICWDVNGYYRELGVHWKATRKELRRAYAERNGQDSIRLTYVLLQLLDPEVRREYDRTPLGGQFLDEYAQEEIRMRAYEEVGRRMRAGQEADADSILGEWGYQMVAEEEEPEDQDIFHSSGPYIDGVNRITPDTPEDDLSKSWGFGYYLWRRDHHNLNFLRDFLPQWQSDLIREMSYRGITMPFGVGICTDTEREYHIRREGPNVVFYLCLGGYESSGLNAVHAVDEFRLSPYE